MILFLFQGSYDFIRDVVKDMPLIRILCPTVGTLFPLQTLPAVLSDAVALGAQRSELLQFKADGTGKQGISL